MFNQLSLAMLGYILAIRFTRRSGNSLHLIIIAVQGIDNGIQSVISPCRESGSITSAPRLYRTFHDLLMPPVAVLMTPKMPLRSDSSFDTCV